MRSLWRLVPYFRPYRVELILGLLCVVVSGAFGSVVPWLLRRAVDGLSGATRLQVALAAAGEMLAAAVIAGLFRFGMRQYLNSLSRRIEFDLRNDVFAHLLTLDAAYFGTMRTGEVMARLTNDLAAVRMAAGPAIMYLVNTVVGGCFALGFMLAIDLKLSALALLPLLPLPFLTERLGRAVHARFERVQETFGDLTTRTHENFSGTRVVRAFRQEASEIDRFRTLSDEYMIRNLGLARLQALVDPSFRVMAGFGAVVVLGVGGGMVVKERISAGAFIAFGLYLGMLTWPLIALGWVTNLFQRGAASMSRLLEIVDARPSIADCDRPRSLPPTLHGRAIEFRNVSFRYPAVGEHAGRLVLRNVSFRVAAGETLGVAGATASGKTALLELLARTYDPNEGDILLDGVPIREIPLKELRAALGVVPQETMLFSDTLRTNIAYGSATDDDVEWAAESAHLLPTIRQLPDGFETRLGERGINLSGGQKQRAAIARALARKPSIVVLDDALSAVDTQTESEILHSLRSVLQGRTAVIASHRSSALRETDHVVVLDQGQVVERGTHTALLQNRGRYWELVRRQEIEAELDSA